MKKIMLITCTVFCSVAIFAQAPVTSNMESKTSNTAYNVPEYIKVNYETTYPGVDASVWEPVNGIWRVTYKNNNRINQIYYNREGEMYTVVLPVLKTSVPENIITAAIDLYGAKVYAITKMKNMDSKDIYKLKIVDKGTASIVVLDEQGNRVAGEEAKVSTETPATTNGSE